MHRTVKLFAWAILMAGSSFIVWGQQDYPPEIECDREVVYKTIGDTELKLWIFQPENHKPAYQAPAIVFYFGGGWRGGSPKQFSHHCEYLAARGMLAMVADYRVASRHGVKALACVSDAKSAIRWIREHAPELGVDPKRVAAGGGSAGGHLAAATATLPGFDEEDENLAISSSPDALVLFNPALVLAPTDEKDKQFTDRLKDLKKRLGTEPESISPYHNISGGLPPAIIFHGTGDNTVPFESAKKFTDEMKKQGNQCTLVAYKDEGHGFFNYGLGNNGAYISTVHRMDSFLVSLGYLDPPPEVVKLK